MAFGVALFNREPSLLRTLRRIADRRALREARRRCADWRAVPAALAAASGTSELIIMKDAALALELPFLHRVSALPAEALTGRPDLNDFRRAGAIGIAEGRGIIGLVCVDPREARRLFPLLGAVPLYLSTWSAISDALDRSGAPDAGERSNPDPDPARRALSLMLQEAARRGARHLSVDLRSDPASYHFQTAAGLLGAGTLHSAVCRAVGALLLDESSALVPLTDGDSDSVYTVRRDTPGIFAVDLLGAYSSGDESGSEPMFSEEHCGEERGPTIVRGEQVLVIDDQPAFAEVLARYLTRAGHQVQRASNARDALKGILTGAMHLPLAIVCDLHLPSMGGEELLHAIRAAESLADTPVIILSADDDIESEIRLIEAGAMAFVAKNRDPRILLAHLSRLPRRCGLEQAA